MWVGLKYWHVKLSCSSCSSERIPVVLYGWWPWGSCHHTLQRCLLQKHHKSLGSYPEHLYFAGGPLLCLAPVTFANTFSSTGLLAALSRRPPPNKVVFFSLSVSTIIRCTIIGLTGYLLSLSCVIGWEALLKGLTFSIYEQYCLVGRFGKFTLFEHLAN